MRLFTGYKKAEAAQTKSERLRMLLPHMVDESTAIIAEMRPHCKISFTGLLHQALHIWENMLVMHGFMYGREGMLIHRKLAWLSCWLEMSMFWTSRLNVSKKRGYLDMFA